MIAPRYTGGGLRVLDFDTESRPLSWIGPEYTSVELTAIACQPVGKPKELKVWILGEVELEEMLDGFLEEWAKADIVTGHNIIRHDLPRIGAMLLEHERPGLGPKRTHDTYAHLRRRQGISASQESLAATLGVAAPKVGMGQKAWREANRLLPEGLVKTRARVVGDVKQHIKMRERLLELDWLKPPQMWRP